MPSRIFSCVKMIIKMAVCLLIVVVLDFCFGQQRCLPGSEESATCPSFQEVKEEEEERVDLTILLNTAIL